jgi:hypothetical protein
MIPFLLSCMFLSLLFGLVLLVKNQVTYLWYITIVDAIYKYSIQNIDDMSIKDIETMYDSLAPYDTTLLRLWDWGPTKIVRNREMYDKIKPYITLREEATP